MLIRLPFLPPLLDTADALPDDRRTLA